MKSKRGYYDMLVKTCANWPSNTAVRVYNNGQYETYTYSELYGVCEYITQRLQLLQSNRGIIGIVSTRNAIVPSVIAAVHKYNIAFMFLRSITELSSINYVQFNVILTINDKEELIENHRPDYMFKIFNLIISFFVMNNQDCKSVMKKYSFISQTSGSTGQPKYIQVPTICIQPNVNDFTKLFSITASDVIYFSTPLTFDPSMIEILLACQNGASLLIAPEEVNILFPEDFQHSITIWQTTPSKFFQYSENNIKQILSENSSLKVLALGGEPFLCMNKLRELKNIKNRTKLFALYGVTEMSCWASVVELDCNKYANTDIPLGNCLSQTKLCLKTNEENNNTGNIILESKTRKCFILNNGKATNREESIDTGDLGEIINGEIYYRGRNDEVIKRFGHKVNLQLIESTAMKCCKLKCCSCLWIPKTKLIIMYYSSYSINSIELSNFLKENLEHSSLPDKLVQVNDIAVTDHGKLSKQSLLTYYENSLKSIRSKDNFEMAFVNELKFSLNSSITFEDIKDKDFFSIGGTSILAVMLCNRLTIEYPDESKIILPYLLSQKYTLGAVITRAKDQFNNRMNKVKVRKKRNRLPVENIGVMKKKGANVSKHIILISEKWHYNTGKCVDASPVLFQNKGKVFVTVGSHSGKLVSIEAVTGKVSGLITMTSRIEAEVCVFHNAHGTACGITGTYDGTVVCFTIEHCSQLWTCNVGAMVKSKAVFWNDFVYIAAYDGYIRCINSLNGQIVNVIKISEHAISSDLELAGKHLLCGSLGGDCSSLQMDSDTIVWKKTLNSPVFASPLVFDDCRYVIYAQVNGMIHCFSVNRGVEIWKYTEVKGNIFSSLTSMKRDNVWQIVFGCHDNYVYCLTVDKVQASPLWRVNMHAPVYSTPSMMHGDIIVAISTKGKLCLISAEGSVLKEYVFGGEVFSSPTVYESYIFVGCRNDNLYGLMLERNN